MRDAAVFGRNNTGLYPKRKEIDKIVMPPSIAEAHVDLRQELLHNVFWLANGDLGVVYEVEGIYDEPLTHDELNSEVFLFYKLLRAVVPGIPNHAALGNIMVHVICSQRELKDKSRIEIEAKRTHLEPSIAQQIIEKEEDLLFQKGMVERKFYIGVRYSSPRLSLLKRTLKFFKDVVTKKTSAIIEDLEAQAQFFHEELTQKEIESGLRLRRLDATELVAYYNSVLNCGEPLPYVVDAGAAEENEFVSLHDLVLNEQCEAKPDGLVFDNGKSIRAYVMKMLPRNYLLGRIRKLMDDLPIKTFDLVWIFGDGKVQPDNKLGLKKLWFARGPSHQSKMEDLVKFSDKIDNLRPYGMMGLRLLAYNLPDEQKSSILDRAVTWLGVPIIEEKQQALHFVVSSLPLNCQKYGLGVPGRYVTTRLEAATGFIPVYKGPELSGPACRYWGSRSRTPTCFDIFRGQDNRMTVMLGRSGAGKSCLNSQLILEFLARFPDGIVRIIDRRTSYQKLCDIYGGQVVEFSEEHLKENPFSPFYAERYDEDIVASIQALIETVIAQTNKGESIKMQHSEVLKEAISRALNEHIRNLQYSKETGAETYEHIIWDPDIKQKLYDAGLAKGFKGWEKVVDDITRWTIGLDESGMYGFIFSRHEKKRLETSGKRIVVYDLQNIAQENLQIIAAQLAFMKIALDIRRAPLSTTKLVNFEELGVLLQGDNAQTKEMANNFVKEVVKTCRKTNSIAFGITNDVEDYTLLPGGKTFWNQSTQKIFLPSTLEMVEELQKNFRKISAADLQIIGDLRIDKSEKYSQAYLISEISPYKGSFDIPLSPQLDALVTTSPDQLGLYARLKKQGRKPEEIIDQMAKEHPYGEDLSC